MIVAYMTWQASLENGCLDSIPVPPPADEVEGLYNITVMDVFREFLLNYIYLQLTHGRVVLIGCPSQEM
jgi:hypothetical protein